MSTRRFMMRSIVLGVFIISNVFVPLPFLGIIWSVFLAWFNPLIGHKYCFGLIFFESQIMLARSTFVPGIVSVAFAYPVFWWTAGTFSFMLGNTLSYLTAFFTISKFNLRKRIGQFIS